MLRRLGSLTAILLVGTLVVPLVVAPAAGAADLLDRKKLAKQVGASVATAHPDLPVTRVRCPKKVKVKAAVTATCTVTAGTYALEMLVTVTDKKGNVTIASTQAVIPKANAEFLVAANSTLGATVDCGPDAYLVRRPGETFTCNATFPDGTQSQVTVTVDDIAGNVTITAAT